MDAIGARQLRRRLEQQEHWRQAPAVREGRQPASDPDAHELESIGDGIRYYGRDQLRVGDNGNSSVVSVRIVKRLVDGEWQRALVPADVEATS